MNNQQFEDQLSAYIMNNTPPLYQSGNGELMSKKKTAFLCSRQVPENETVSIYRWTNQLSPERDCILCGNHSKMEQEVFHMLLEKKIPIILVLAESIKEEWPLPIKLALEEKRLLIVTACNDKVHRINHQSAYERNEIILSLANHIIIGYCRPGGNINKQISGKANVTLLHKPHYQPAAPTFMMKAADSDVMSYRTSTKGGEIFLDIKQDLCGQEYLKITQSKHQGNKDFHRETIFINKDEILQFKQELDKAIEYWGLNPIKQQQTLRSKREEYGNAYLPWEKSADNYLLRLYEEGKTIHDLTEIFERNDGAIRSRLQKLGVKLK